MQVPEEVFDRRKRGRKQRKKKINLSAHRALSLKVDSWDLTLTDSSQGKVEEGSKVKVSLGQGQGNAQSQVQFYGF